MSHKACHWLEDLPADYCKAGAFRVLFHLCCAHNAKRPPAEACFPSQAELRRATGLSNGGLNKCLNELEAAGMFWRRRTKKPNGTKGPTYYILRFDFKDAPKPTPHSGVPANSTPVTKPTPLWEPNQLHPSGDKPVREPGIIIPGKPEKEEDFYSQFLERHPRPRETAKGEAAFAEAIKTNEPSAIVAAAAAYAKEVANWDNPHFISYSDNWLADPEKWKPYLPSKKKAPANLICGLNPLVVDAIRDGKRHLCGQISIATAHQLIAAGHVTPDECKAAGINL